MPQLAEVSPDRKDPIMIPRLAIEILAHLRGYSEQEVEEWTSDPDDPEHKPELLEDLNYLTAHLYTVASVGS